MGEHPDRVLERGDPLNPELPLDRIGGLQRLGHDPRRRSLEHADRLHRASEEGLTVAVHLLEVLHLLGEVAGPVMTCQLLRELQRLYREMSLLSTPRAQGVRQRIDQSTGLSEQLLVLVERRGAAALSGVCRLRPLADCLESFPGRHLGRLDPDVVQRLRPEGLVSVMGDVTDHVAVVPVHELRPRDLPDRVRLLQRGCGDQLLPDQREQHSQRQILDHLADPLGTLDLFVRLSQRPAELLPRLIPRLADLPQVVVGFFQLVDRLLVGRSQLVRPLRGVLGDRFQGLVVRHRGRTMVCRAGRLAGNSKPTSANHARDGAVACCLLELHDGGGGAGQLRLRVLGRCPMQRPFHAHLRVSDRTGTAHAKTLPLPRGDVTEAAERRCRGGWPLSAPSAARPRPGRSRTPPGSDRSGRGGR